MTFRANLTAKHIAQPDLLLVEQPYSFTKNGDGKPTFFYVQPNFW